MKKQVTIDPEEMKYWEERQEENKYVNFKSKSGKMKDPGIKRKKEKERKEKVGMYFYTKEEKTYRKQQQKKFRSKWKIERSRERYHIPRTREYKTYGYLTW